jgi:hypothetical protein
MISRPSLAVKNKIIIPFVYFRAVETNQEEIVSLIFDIKMEHDRFDLSSLFMSCDQNGRNVFHYAVKNPNVLKFLLLQFVLVNFKPFYTYACMSCGWTMQNIPLH